MRINTPVTQQEYVLRDDTLIVSTTDLKGRITFVNPEFVQVSGFTETELIGKAHNIVRHPDMPEEAFADFWRTLQAGRPWMGMVKNRCKNGDYYWVLANATPVREGNAVTGYMSVRTKPAREQVTAAENAYRMFREKRADGHAIRDGRVVRISLAGRFNFFARATLGRKNLILSTLFLLPALVGLLALLMPGAFEGIRNVLATLLTASIVSGVIAGWRQVRRTATVLRTSAAHVEDLTQGHFEKTLVAEGEDEAAGLQRALQSLRTKMGYQIAESRREGSRIRQALDKTSASVMLADENFNIVYVNDAAHRLFREAQADFQRDLPTLDAEKIVGSSIDIFHRNPAHQRQLLESLRGMHAANIRIGSRAMRIVASTVTDTDGRRLGTVVEWFDRTQEVRSEEEVSAIVKKALAGDLTERVRLEGKTGFFEVLGRGLNELLENMATIIHGMKTAATEVHRGAEEISSGNANLSQRTEEQSSSLEETASSMEEMTSTVKQNADNAAQANQLAAAARDQAEKGGMVVGKAVNAMTEINESSRKIADIIGVIDDIAFQTNLLALNAAVEAARAGEQGRGFAVVASEVRNLAGRSATAAKEIKSLIQDSVRKVEDGSALVTQSGQTLEQIMLAVKKVSDIVAEIAAASREQSSGIEQVNRAVMQMDEMTQQNAALVEQGTAASQAMADQARNLNDVMARYRIGESASANSGAAAASGIVQMERRAPKRPWGNKGRAA